MRRVSFHSSEESESAPAEAASKSMRGGATALLLVLAARPPRLGATGFAGEEGKDEEAGRCPLVNEAASAEERARKVAQMKKKSLQVCRIKMRFTVPCY